MIEWNEYNEKLVREAQDHGKVVKVLADPAYDSKNNFYTYNNDIVAGIKVRKNSSCRPGRCHPRMISVISQLRGYRYWKDSVSYGKRWIAESVFSVFKRVFGECVRAVKWNNMVKEMQLKASLHNRFMSM